MDLDNQELKETKKRNGIKNINKEKIEKIIKRRICEIDNEEWDINDSDNIKFYCKEELQNILFRIKEM